MMLFWFTPLLAIDIVGWMDARIKVFFNQIVIKELFKKRISLSDEQRKLTDVIVKYLGQPENQFYSFLGYTLNCKIFGKHEIGIRDTATDQQFEDMLKLMKLLQSSIEIGFINSYQSIFDTIERFNLS